MERVEKKELIKAFQIGGICVGTYLISYVFRALLSVLTPLMLENGGLGFTKETIAFISSTYMICYASGQLLFGIVGDYVKPKHIVPLGLTVAGIGLFIFPLLPVALRVIGYILLGLGLSSLRGPLVKVISENNTAPHARFTCVVFSFVSFLGPAVAGIAVLFLNWDTIYTVSGCVAIGFAIGAYLLLTLLEKQGKIVYRFSQKQRRAGGIFDVFRVNGFVAYMLIGMIAEIGVSSIDFWFPTYISEHLGFPSDSAGIIFSAVTFLKAFSPFLCLIILKLFRDNDAALNTINFGVATLFFAMMVYIYIPWLNILLFLVARIMVAMCSAALWTVYIPSLAATGKVSSANGILDCAGYIAAAGANLFVPPIMEAFGWNGTVWSWAAFTGCGLLIGLVQCRNRQKAISN